MTPFSAEFRECLRQILRRAPRVRSARDRDAQGRQRALARTGTFAGHRSYSQGDDLRHVDWNAYARTGELFLKLLEEDDRRTLTICLDRSASMATGDPDRLMGAQRLAAILGGLALVQMDGLTLVAGTSEVETFEGAGSVARLLDVLAALAPDVVAPIELLRAPIERGWSGSLVWISDFAEPEKVQPALHLLRRHGRRCVGWLPALRTDRVPSLDGRVVVVDPETMEEHVLEVDADLRSAMVAQLELLARQQDSVFAAVGYPLVRFELPEEGDFRLTSWVNGPWTFPL